MNEQVENKPFYELYKDLLLLKEYRANPEAAYATADFVWQRNWRHLPAEQDKDLVEKIEELIGEYSGKIMRQHPKWVFNPDDATNLRDSILSLILPKREEVRQEMIDWMICKGYVSEHETSFYRGGIVIQMTSDEWIKQIKEWRSIAQLSHNQKEQEVGK